MQIKEGMYVCTYVGKTARGGNCKKERAREREREREKERERERE
jgi:hypothetical protein